MKREYLKVVASFVGVVVVVALVKSNPILAVALVVSAALYFYGDRKIF